MQSQISSQRLPSLAQTRVDFLEISENWTRKRKIRKYWLYGSQSVLLPIVVEGEERGGLSRKKEGSALLSSFLLPLSVRDVTVNPLSQVPSRPFCCSR